MIEKIEITLKNGKKAVIEKGIADDYYVLKIGNIAIFHGESIADVAENALMLYE